MRALFVTNFCPHYRVKTFEALARRMEVSFLFVSPGDEAYWDPRHGVQRGRFEHEYLSGFGVGPWRIPPGLVTRVWNADVDVVISAIAGRLALPATFLACRLRRRPFVLWTGLWSHPGTAFHRLTFPALRHIYRRSQAVVAYGTHVRDYLAGLGVPRESVFVAPHAVDNDLYAQPVAEDERRVLRERHGLGTRPVVLYVGRLVPDKGLPVLLEAAGRLADLSPVLCFAGEGALRPELESEARRLGVETRFLGYVPTGELYRLYAIADAFVLPSVTTRAGREPWGLVVNEVMNQGTPVVASEAVGAAAGGLVRHGETGLVVPEGDGQALAGALRALLGDPALARRLGEAGRLAVRKHDNEAMADAFVAAAEHARRAAL